MYLKPVKPSVSVANIREIALLDGTAEYCLSDLVEELRQYVAFDGFKMTWTDENDGSAGIWHKSPDMQAGSQSMVVFQRQFYNAREAEAVKSTSALLRSPGGLDNCAQYGADFFRSELFQTILSPLGFKHALRLALRGPDRAVGFLTLTRGFDEKPFSGTDEARLHSVKSILAHAMAKTTLLDASQLVPSSMTAFMIVDDKAQIEYLSDDARQFLTHIFAPESTVDDLNSHFGNHVRFWLSPLVRQTQIANKGHQSNAPDLYRQNKWGGFSARAYRMNGHETGRDGLVGIVLTRHLPLGSRLLRLNDVRQLPSREKQVCLLLAQGYSIPEIAQRLAISPHTATGHVSSLYHRFDVNSREKLMTALLTAG